MKYITTGQEVRTFDCDDCKCSFDSDEYGTQDEYNLDIFVDRCPKCDAVCDLYDPED